MSENAAFNKLCVDQASRCRHWLSIITKVRVGRLFGVGLFIFLVWLGAPLGLWAYNLQNAGQLMEQGLSWPDPRLVDSYPKIRDEAKLAVALSHISAAIRWLPDHPFPYRQAALVYEAREDWLKAAEALDHAATLAPRNPLIAWERALVDEAMWDHVRTASSTNLLPELASVPIGAPDALIGTPLCQDGKSHTCYVGLTTWVQPYAAFQDGPPASREVLFMHPPANVRLSHTISTDNSALQFLMGLDPVAYDYGTDGATFNIWLEAPGGERSQVFEHTVDGMTARSGWVPGFVDLSPWTGQTVTLVLQTTGGPAGDTTGDWFGWGNVMLTTSRAAQYAMRMPKVEMQRAWSVAGLHAEQFVVRGDQSFRMKQYAEAGRWYARATDWKPAQQFDLLFRSAIAAVISASDAAPALVAAVHEHDKTFPLYRLDKALTIPGNQFRWISPIAADATYGIPLASLPEHDSSGFLWFSGEAVAVLQAKQAGSYMLRVQSRHSTSGPIDVAIGVDGVHLKSMSLDHKDNSWETIEVPVTLRAGLHTLHFSFLNDGYGPGGDLNAELSSVQVQRIDE